MTDWQTVLAAPLAAAEHGVAAADRHFATTHDGPLSFEHIDYPAAQTYLETVERTGGTEWQHTIGTVLYFEWGRETSTREDIVHPVTAVVEQTLAALSDVECITDYHPARFDFFSGEPTDGLVLAVNIQFRVRTLVDPGTFDTA